MKSKKAPQSQWRDFTTAAGYRSHYDVADLFGANYLPPTVRPVVTKTLDECVAMMRERGMAVVAGRGQTGPLARAGWLSRVCIASTFRSSLQPSDTTSIVMVTRSAT